MVPLTDDVEKQILAFLRAGGTPHVAAQAAGISADSFAQWCQEGKSPRGRRRYRRFVQAVEQAAAQARLGAEVNIHRDKPLEWLKQGPAGGEWGRSPGKRSSGFLTMVEVQALLAEVLMALEEYPEARQVAARALEPSEAAAQRESARTKRSTRGGGRA